MTESAASPPAGWLHDTQILREHRGLQRHLAELGARVPILDLLVMRGHLPRTVLPAGQACFGDPLTHTPEAEVLAHLRAAGRLAESDWLDACNVCRAIEALGVAATPGTILLQRGVLRLADLAEFAAVSGAPPAPAESVPTETMRGRQA